MIEITPLGAGQDVGRSCILVSIGGKNLLLDCGMHMGYDDERRFPDFSFVSAVGDFDGMIDAVLISHFHLDHCGALPYFTEMCGYFGPIYMSHPTRAICPLLLEDYRKITIERKGASDFFTTEDIKNCMRKVTCIQLHQTVKVDDELEITAYYAGHVLGAVMFHIRVGTESIVYTGDYNMTADRHLGPAWIDNVKPTVLITETTYATTVRDSKRARERDFLKKVHQCVERGGKVLIPVFALGRAQELCILIENYWDRMGIKVPIYFSAGMTQKANHYYRLYTNWTSTTLKKPTTRNMFDFRHITAFEMAYADQEGPMVLFASPGMLHAGTSLNVFKKWAPNPQNMVILPGYCVPGTVGARVLAGDREIEVDGGQKIPVKLKVQYLSFSAHADARGIQTLIRQCQPENVVLVHGEADGMKKLGPQIEQVFGISCFDPPNGGTVCIQSGGDAEVEVSERIVEGSFAKTTGNGVPRSAEFEGILILRSYAKAQLLHPEEASELLNSE